MKKPQYTGATVVLCEHCGSSVLTWSPDHWLAAHEQVFKCGNCGRLNAGPGARRDVSEAGPVRHPVRLRH